MIIEKRSLLGVPPETLVSTLLDATDIKAARTVFKVALGYFCKYSATTPVTCGAAMEVPLKVSTALVEPIESESISDPGA
ncbi:hypothetical protein SDC9_158372 [bioreactor metagenome]|uniref:Uncharacterized protein n=1 Tax=bioreactor metagenome TaxID=1076179 RepID=A0A645F9U2_9ZZZZ